MCIVPKRREKSVNTRFFYKHHFYKQQQTEIDKKIKQKLSNILSLNFYYFKISCFFHPHHHPKIIGDILENMQKQVRQFKWGFMINDNKNEAEIEK